MIAVKNGDAAAITGDYQFHALNRGPAVQRFWHHAKLLAVRRYLPPVAGDYVLDVGCGSGVLCGFLGNCGARVLGIDINPAAIEFARAQFGSPSVSFAQQLVDVDLPVEGPVDKAYCLEVIEHIYPAQGLSMLKQLYAVMCGGGRLLLTTPNYRSAWPLIEWLMDRSGRFPRLEDEQHVAHYRRRSLRKLCQAAGFTVDLMTTINLLAPWMAALSWSSAQRLFDWESRHSWLPGCNLVCVLRKPRQDAS